jgi:hypothetical protein
MGDDVNRPETETPDTDAATATACTVTSADPWRTA